MKLDIVDPTSVKLPATKKEVDELFERLKAVARTDPEYSKLKKTYFDGINMFPIFAVQQDVAALGKTTIYRARPFCQIKQEDIYNLSEYGAPPINKQCGTGRANWNGRNVFYGSNQLDTSIAETKRYYAGEEFYISKWSFNMERLRNFSYVDTGILTKYNLPEENILHELSKKIPDQVQESFKKFSSKQQSILSYLHDKICDLY